jgi:hypothetical protein
MVKQHATQVCKGVNVTLYALWMEVSDELHASSAVLPEKSSRLTLNTKLSGPQNRSGRAGQEKDSYRCRESNPVHCCLSVPLQYGHCWLTEQQRNEYNIPKGGCEVC